MVSERCTFETFQGSCLVGSYAFQQKACIMGYLTSAATEGTCSGYTRKRINGNEDVNNLWVKVMICVYLSNPAPNNLYALAQILNDDISVYSLSAISFMIGGHTRLKKIYTKMPGTGDCLTFSAHHRGGRRSDILAAKVVVAPQLLSPIQLRFLSKRA